MKSAASTDNVGVTGYKIFRNGTQVGTSATNSYSDAGLSASTDYSYTVSAYDAAGNNSAQSASSLGTVAGGPTTASGHTWWQINYDNGIKGWSIADYLSVVSASSSPVVGMADPLPSIAFTQPYTSLVHQLSNKSKN